MFTLARQRSFCQLMDYALHGDCLTLHTMTSCHKVFSDKYEACFPMTMCLILYWAQALIMITIIKDMDWVEIICYTSTLDNGQVVCPCWFCSIGNNVNVPLKILGRSHNHNSPVINPLTNLSLSMWKI